MIILTMNEKTGEVKEFSIASPFRSITDLKDYKDSEKYQPGTSVTTLEGYEPLASIIARCMRSVRSPNGIVYQVIDKDALKAEETQTGIYEAGTASNVDEAFATADPTESQGFDLADASQLQIRVSEELRNAAEAEASAKLSPKGENEAPSNSEVSDVVENSASKRKDSAFPEKESISSDTK